MIARHETLRPKSPGLARLEHENRFGLHRSPPSDSPESAWNGDHALRRTRAAGTLAARTRGISDAIDVEDPALLAVTCGVNRWLRQDASPLNQQTTDARRHPKNFDESPDSIRPRTFRPLDFACPGGLCAVDTATVQQALLHHSWWLRRARRAKLVSSGLPLFDGFVVRAGPECRPKATSTGALPWCPGSKARTPSSRRKRLCDPRFQAEITSFSRLPPRDPGTRVELPVGNSNRARGEEESFAGILQPCSRGFLHSTTFTGTPLDRASPSTSPRTISS